NLATGTKTDMKPTPQGWVIFTREKVGDFEVQNDTYYGHIRASASQPSISYVIVGGRSDCQKVPNLLCQTIGSVPRSLRRWLQRLHWTIPSSLV
ncbi:MAG: hypothetical protein L0Y58_10780, partial [Verrucomicrobia subdivision 3 bacterium]|nr:hypothetical protein [Limisphaerales bacterium]